MRVGQWRIVWASYVFNYGNCGKIYRNTQLSSSQHMYSFLPAAARHTLMSSFTDPNFSLCVPVELVFSFEFLHSGPCSLFPTFTRSQSTWSTSQCAVQILGWWTEKMNDELKYDFYGFQNELSVLMCFTKCYFIESLLNATTKSTLRCLLMIQQGYNLVLIFHNSKSLTSPFAIFKNN